MITGIFHQGSGLGNQLHRCIATRVRALDLDVEWGMFNPQLFKGKDFMQIKNNDIPMKDYSVWQEKKIVENGVDIRSYDPEFNFIQDETVIDGEFQDERYWAHRGEEVNEWLKVEPLEVPDDVCVIGFRGGEFSVFPDLFLTREYWLEAINTMKFKGVYKFEVHTDDIETAQQQVGSFLDKETKFIHDIGINWRSMRYAKHAIIANSSFFILPRWLRNGYTIAPRFWARRNTQTWALPQNYYSRFHYI